MPDSQCCVHGVVKLQDGGTVAKAIHVVGGAERRHYVTVVTPLVTLSHDTSSNDVA